MPATGGISYRHRGGGAPLLGVTIPARFAEIAARFPDREAIVCRHQGRRLTYRELVAEIDRVAKALIALGYGRGNRIGVWSTNNIEWLLLQMATARIGVILVNINPAYRPPELSHALNASEVECLFTIPAFRASNYVEMLSGLVPGVVKGGGGDDAVPSLRHLVLYDPVDPEPAKPPCPGLMCWQDFLAGGAGIGDDALEATSAALDPDDAINIQFTSGTTGFPKAVVLSHHNILNNAYFTARAMHFDETGRLCVPVPFYHCFGMVLSNLLCLAVGACIVVPDGHFDALAVLQAVAGERCTGLHGVPTMFIAELEHPRLAEFDLSSLRTGIMAGAPCPPELMKRVIGDMHCREILIGYGQTEASPITHLTRPEDNLIRRTETVGTNLEHQEVKVIDPGSGRILPLDEVGKICFRGYHVMRGYYNNPEATAKTIDPASWLHSGDLGSMDADGYLRITGRLKEMIIRGGENIYPAEIEAHIFTHPKVAQVAVFGVADERLGEEVAAWVQLHQGARMEEEELRRFCADGMAHYKVPRVIRFVDEFPMTVTGKPQKFRMREMMEEPSAA